MTQEEKQLFLKDLCARLPYGIKVEVCVRDKDIKSVDYVKYDTVGTYIRLIDDENFSVKPYLRPIQSMTDEEMEDYARHKFSSDEIWEIVDFKRTGKGFININCKNRNDASNQWTFQVSQKSPLENHRGIDWLNAHHFDYRGLIKMGLAKKATEGIY